MFWTLDNLLAFSHGGTVLAWDGTATHLLTGITGAIRIRWSPGGYSTVYRRYYASDPRMAVIDPSGKLVMHIAGGQFSGSTWSDLDLLLFCEPLRPGFMLRLWNGTETIDLWKGGNLWAEWPNGNRFGCTYG